MKLLFTGDFCQNARLFQIFDEGKYESCFGNIKRVFDEMDYRVVNLETPIVGINSRQIPYKINLRANKSILGALTFLGVDCCALANNHMMDYLEDGLKNTLFELTKNNIDYVGAGLNLEEKRRMSILNSLDNERIGLLNYCEHEFSVTRPNAPGCNPLSFVNVFEDIRKAKELVDYIIIIIHGGHEHYNLPSPEMKRVYHMFVDMGADVLINHHQHCYSGYEVYNGKYIFYGLGNFCFDWSDKRQSPWNYGYMVELVIKNGINFKVIPYNQMDARPEIMLLSGEELFSFERQLAELNRIIQDDNQIEESFNSFCERMARSIKLNLSPYSNRYSMGMASRSFLPLFDNHKRLFRLLNYIECEAHREVILNVLHQNVTI